MANSRLLKLFLKSDCFYDEMFPALSEAMQFYKGTERGMEAVSEVTKKWKQEGYEKGHKEGTTDAIKFISKLKRGEISVSEVAKELNVSEEEIRELLQ